MKLKRVFPYIISSLIAFALLTSCGKQAPTETDQLKPEDSTKTTLSLTGSQINNAGIAFGKIEQRQISGAIKASGVLDVPPQQLVSISAPLAGFLKNTTLLQGSHVKKGQAIATIENLEFIQMQQDYVDAKTHFEFAKADYERQQQLAKENVNSEKTMQQAKTNFTSWQAKYNGLREKLKVVNLNRESIESGNFTSLINIYSPIDGYVTQVNVNIGKFVNSTDVLFEIVDTEHLHAELTVFEKDVPKLKIGQKVRFTLSNETKERFATVYLIGRQISPERTIRIHCHIDKEDKNLLPGMYLTAFVETGGSLVSALPDDAIISYQGKKYIFLPDGNITLPVAGDQTIPFKMIEVETGNSESGYTEVTLHDLQNASVVIKGGYSLLSTLKNTEE